MPESGVCSSRNMDADTWLTSGMGLEWSSLHHLLCYLIPAGTGQAGKQGLQYHLVAKIPNDMLC